MSDEHEKTSVIEWLRWTIPPIFYAILGVGPFILLQGYSGRPGLPLIFGVTIAALYAGCLIRLIVIWINRRDDPRSAKTPPDDP